MKVRDHIRAKIVDYMYSILVDETCDVFKKEQMALVLRSVDKMVIRKKGYFMSYMWPTPNQ
jgi:hypothetical protein